MPGREMYRLYGPQRQHRMYRSHTATSQAARSQYPRAESSSGDKRCSLLYNGRGAKSAENASSTRGAIQVAVLAAPERQQAENFAMVHELADEPESVLGLQC